MACRRGLESCMAPCHGHNHTSHTALAKPLDIDQMWRRDTLAWEDRLWYHSSRAHISDRKTCFQNQHLCKRRCIGCTWLHLLCPQQAQQESWATVATVASLLQIALQTLSKAASSLIQNVKPTVEGFGQPPIYTNIAFMSIPRCCPSVAVLPPRSHLVHMHWWQHRIPPHPWWEKTQLKYSQNRSSSPCWKENTSLLMFAVMNS